MPLRATTAAAKTARREKMLDTAADAFDRLGFDAMNMDRLARRAGVAKGTLYLYFPSKEGLFLELCQRELLSWFDAVRPAVEQLPPGNIARLAGLLVDELERRPRLLSLAAILHSQLERNVSTETLQDFRRFLLAQLETLGRALEGRLDFLAAGDGVRLLLRFHALSIGFQHVAAPGLPLRRLLEMPAFSPFRLEYSEELENALILLLEGWQRRGESL